jgi:hypothetical protein
MGWAYSVYGGKQCCIQFLVGKPKRKKLLGRPRYRWRIILGWIFRKSGVGIRLNIYIYIYIYVCVCVCVCVT